MGSYQSGFVFRENKFAADPTLPFDSLAMPDFNKLGDPEDSYALIESNHFLCQCDAVGWFIGAMEYGFDIDILNREPGSLAFLRQIYQTASSCVQCGLTSCQTTDQGFREFGKSALTSSKGLLLCSKSGHPLKSKDPSKSQSYSPNDILKLDDSKHSDDAQRLASGSSNVAYSLTVTMLCLIFCVQA